MTQSGLFSPAQIQSVLQAWASSNNPAGGTLTDKGGGNTAAEMQSWPAELMSGLNQANAASNSAASTNAASTTNSANPAAAAANPAQSITPATIQSQFPNGIPSYTASGVGSVPSVSASDVMGTGGIGYNNVNAATVNPGMSIAATENYLNPQFQQQDQALTANLANAGIVGGTSAQAQAQLGQQQQTTLQNDIQPFLQQGALANQSSINNAQATNQNAAINTGEFTAGQNLAAQQSNQAAGLTASQANQNAALTGGEFNANAQNQNAQFNIQNLLNTGQIDAATANQMTQYVMGLQNQDWLAQLGAQTNLATTAEGATTSAFNPVYSQPSSTNASGLGSLASAFTSNNTGVTQPTNSTPYGPGSSNGADTGGAIQNTGNHFA